jgi:O-antigen ligase
LPRTELNIYWYWLQVTVLILPLNNVISVISLLLLIGVFSVQQGWRELDTPVNRGWLGLAVWFLITTAIAFDPTVAWTGLLNFLPFFLLFAIASFLIQTGAQLQQIAWLWVLSSIPVSLLGILQGLLNQPKWTLPRLFGSYEITLGMSPDRRVASLFGHFNEAAMYLVLILPIALYFALPRPSPPTPLPRGDGSKGKLAVGILAIALITLVLLGSRNAWALTAIAIFSLSLYYRYWWVPIGLSVSTALISWATWGQMLGIGGEWLRSFFPKGLVNRLASAIDPKLGDYASTQNRLDAWGFAVDLIKMHPIQGWGFRSFDLIAANLGHDLHGLPHEHNFYLTLAVGAGLPALLGFLSLVFWILYKGWQVRLSIADRGLVFAIALSFSLYLLSGMLDVVFYEPRVNILSWLLLSGIYGITRSNGNAADLLAQDRNLQDARDDSEKSV